MNENSIENKRIALLFSGGRDSSLAVCRLAHQKIKIVPITCFNGVTINNEISHYRYKELKNRFPDFIEEHINIPTFGLFRKLSIVTLENDFKEYSTNLVCLGCKLAAYSSAIAHCVENSISVIADGYTSYQSSKYPEQSKEVIEILKNFSAEFGILYINPVFNQDSFQKTKYELFDFGISSNSIEGVCIFADTYSEGKPEDIVTYIYKRLNVCREFIHNLITMESAMVNQERIHKIGAIVVENKKILVVRKEVKGHTEYIIPGGRPEGDETHEQTLRRELYEELNINLSSYKRFGSFTETAVFENIPIFMDVYFVTYEGNPTPKSEIKELVWITKDYKQQGVELGSVLGRHIIPKLVAEGIM